MPISNVGLQILPFSKEKDTYGLVDEAIKVIQESGVKYEVTALETILEGELDVLLDVVKKTVYATVEAGADEVAAEVKIHFRPQGTSIEEKVGKYRK
ncbi:thiamine-binding protein [Sporolactobacillus shoreicorticis]|uniref:MTH1187 family thiamine-binding protein n=1 Tax=Sporolactobacillus shoreicorticis TaxID=1923877 RepID=A0ABW5S565_9BACL|nr:thiamine-binding protein [Sporolactobacillus shoreicorticis]MCO7126706.1 thiamine-binding protein [Sporolactobacillus shoreicorticis]